jgi:protein required for attachment to host cells
MSHLRLRHGLWLAVCDGKRALLLQNSGDQVYPKLETREAFKQDDPPTHEQGSSPPGRVFASGNRRAATEESDFHQQRIEHFLDMFAKDLNHRVSQGEIEALALVAPAPALGVLRTRLSDQTRRAVVAEIDRDYTKMPIYEIERHLSQGNAGH